MFIASLSSLTISVWSSETIYIGKNEDKLIFTMSAPFSIATSSAFIMLEAEPAPFEFNAFIGRIFTS